jgi:O-antigen/teichoic acid export membrane protein
VRAVFDQKRQLNFPVPQAVNIRWNSFFSLLSAGIRLLTNALLFLGVARFYGAEAFGQFTTAHTLSTLFLLLADFGLDLLFTTEVTRQRAHADHLFQSFASVKILFSCVAVIGMWILPLAHNFSETTRWLIYIFGLSVVFNALTNFSFALFKGFEQLQHETRISFIQNLVLLISLVLLGILRAPLWMFAAAFTVTRGLGLLLAAVTATRFVRLHRPKISLTEWKSVMRQGWVFGMQLLCGTLYFQLDTLLLALWQGDHAVGIYQSVMKLVALVLVLQDVAINAVLPVLSRFYGEDEKKWLRLGRLLNKTLLLIGLPIALVFFVYAEQVIQIFYGSEKFAPAVPIMRIAAFIVIIRFAVETYALMLTTSGRHYIRMIIVVIATIVSFMLNSFAIPRYSAYGAALVSLLTSLVVAIGIWSSARSFFVQWTRDAHYVMPVILTIILGIILWNAGRLSLWYSLPLALALYAFICYFSGYTKDERRIIIGELVSK